MFAKFYVGCKIIKAVRVIKIGDITYAKGEPIPRSMLPREEGYRVTYPGGYTSYSPREVFEECYREINPEEVEFVKAGPDGKISEVEMEEWI